MEAKSERESSLLENDLSENQKKVLDSVDIPKELNIQIKSVTPISPEAIEMNDSFGLARKIYQDVLSPQLKSNEEQKRKHKIQLMNNIFSILKWQFIFTYLFVAILIIGVFCSSFLKISDDIVQSIIKFVEFYITSIVVELLSILFFIVKNVFDTSIVDLMKNFNKYNEEDNEKKDN
ncbi:MAG: hypothetical protein K2N15_11245 [Lachnospiraceae bacterium]|nr:hypothetical protein [Lachnospiraceae bacterium]